MENSFCPYCMSRVEEGKPCAACGLTKGSYTPSPHHLPPGTVLKDRYLVGRVLGEGGFGITYIGCDLQLELKVAIKEYFPTDKASRVSQASLEVSSYTGAAGVNYDKGLEKFLREARTIARMDKQPVIVNVRDFFQVNHTAYIVMEYVEGTTFKELVEQRGGRIPAGELLYLMEPLFFALKEMHVNGLIHRDISPENLMLEKGEVRLLDFGCARESADGGNTLTIALKHGYAPVEQYQSKGQGPWTDVYALSATIYYCLTGKKPPQAMDRLLEDELIPPRKLGVDLTQAQEASLLRGMGVAPKRRYQSMDEFHTALYEGFIPAAAEETDSGADPFAAIAADAADAAEAETPAAGKMTAETPSTEEKTAETPPAAEKEPFDFAAWLRKNKLLAGGVAAALALVILLSAVLPRALRPSTTDSPGAVQAENSPGNGPSKDNYTYSMAASDKSSLLSLLENDTVGEIVINPETGGFEVDTPVTLTKTLRVEKDAWVSFTSALTVAEGGHVQIWGDLSGEVLLRTVDGGSISVESGGGMNSPILWLEQEGDLSCAPDGAINVFGEADPTKRELNGWERTHYLELDEEELFADAVHVGSEEEFARYYTGNTPIVIDRNIRFTQAYWVEVPVLIPEGVTVDAPCPDVREEGGGNHTLEMCHGTILINRGTLKGRLALHSYSDDGDDPSRFVNFGTMDANLWTELSSVINLGDMTTREILNDTSLANVGSITVDGTLEVSGNWSNNGGTVIVESGSTLSLYGNTGWNNFGALMVEDGGRLENFAQFYQNSSTLRVRPGGTLVNCGQLWVHGALAAEYGAEEISNYGVVVSRKGGLTVGSGWSSDSTGHIITDDSDWEALGERARWVSSESELRYAMVDNGCDIVIWNGNGGRDKININGGPLTVTKGLILRGSSADTVDLNSGGITVTGENAYLIAENIDFHGNGLTVEKGGTSVINHGEPINLGGLDVTGGGLACFNTNLNMNNCEVNVSGGGQVVDTSGGRWENCTVRIDGDSGLCAYGGWDLIRCDVVNDGSFDNYYAHLYQDGGAFVNNGWASFTGWPDMISLNGNVSNHGDMAIGGSHFIGGAFVNEADGSIELYWEDSPLRLTGRLENKGSIRAAKGSYVETLGGVFTGNKVIFD